MSDLDVFLDDLRSKPWLRRVQELATSRARGRIEIKAKAPLKGALESVIGYPDKMAVTIDAGTIKIRQICNGEDVKIVQNNMVIPANPSVAQALRNSLFHNPNNLYRFVTAEENRERLRLRREDGHRVVVIQREELDSEVIFDQDCRIRRVRYRSSDPDGGTSDNRIEFGDLREWSGLFFPGAVSVFRNDDPLSEIVHETYEPDVELPSDAFSVPAP